MKDPRFQTNVTWWQQIADERARAEAEFDSLGDRSVLVAAMALLLQSNDSEWGEIIGALVSPFSEKLRIDGERFLDSNAEPAGSSWCVIARALALQACTGGFPSAARINAAYQKLESAPQWVVDLFDEAFVEIVATFDGSVRESWLVELGTPPEVPSPAPPPVGPVSVYRAEPAWTLIDVFELWNEGRTPMVLLAQHAPSTLLRRLDAGRWFAVVDSWLDPRVVLGALFGDHVVHDREALLTWLASAEPSFDQSGAWTGQTAAVILTRRVVEYAERLVTAVAGSGSPVDEAEEDARTASLRALRETELPAFFGDAWEVLFRRTDGLVIAAALHAHLSDVGVFTGQRGEADPRTIARRSLAVFLAARGVRTGELAALWECRRRARDESGIGAHASHASGICALLAATEVIDEGGMLDTDLLDWTDQRIRASDSEFAWFARAGELEKLLGRIIRHVAKRPETLDKCERLYADLAQRRRRGELGRTYLESDADLASVLSLLVVLYVIAERGVGQPEGRGALSRAVRSATRLVLTSSPTFDPAVSVQRLFVVALVSCARLDLDQLTNALAVALTDPAFAAMAVAALLAVLPSADLNAVLLPFGETIDTINERALEWAAATERPHDRAASNALISALKALQAS